MLELDPTAGDRVIHRGNDTSNIIFLDKKIEVKPDINGDATILPFRNNVFTKIHCDPPHLIRNDVKHWSDYSGGKGRYVRFGNFKNRNEWLRFLITTNREFARVLKSGGLLWYKIIDGKDRRVTKIVDLRFYENFEEVSREKQARRAGWSTNTCWHLLFKLRGSTGKAINSE